MGEQIRKVLVLNPEKDADIIKFLEKKTFSTYAKQLIEKDMKGDDTVHNNEMYQMYLATNRRIDDLLQKLLVNTDNRTIVTTDFVFQEPDEDNHTEDNHTEDNHVEDNHVEENITSETSSLTEEEEEALKRFQDIGIGF